jgi:hypothetical protein
MYQWASATAETVICADISGIPSLTKLFSDAKKS